MTEFLVSVGMWVSGLVLVFLALEWLLKALLRKPEEPSQEAEPVAMGVDLAVPEGATMAANGTVDIVLNHTAPLEEDPEDEREYARIVEATKNAPTTNEVIRVWRSFQVFNALWPDGEFRLTLLGAYDNPWFSSRMQAGCGNNDGDEDTARVHLATNEMHCACGIYSLKTRAAARHYNLESRDLKVEAECVIWGWIIPGTTGYRSEWCRIDALHVSGNEEMVGRYADALCATYEVPVFVNEGNVPQPGDEAYEPNPYFVSAPTISQITSGVTHRPGPSYHALWGIGATQ